MLNDRLYKALAVVYHQKPKVVNKDQVASITYPPPNMNIYDVETIIPTSNILGGEQYAVCCPFCGDKKHRLYFSYLWNVKMNFGTFSYRCSPSLVRCFNEECQRNPENKKKIIYDVNAAMALSGLDNTASVVLNDPQLDDPNGQDLANQAEMPANCFDIMDGAVPEYVRTYWLGHRQFTPETLKKFGVKFTWARSPLYPGAPICRQMVTVIPVYQNGVYWFCQYRLIPVNGDPNLGYERNQFNEEFPKYIFPRGSRKSWALYNLDNAEVYPTIYVVEGVTDVWRIGSRAVARFGKTLSGAQLKLMETRLQGKEIILVPDMDDPKALEATIEQQVKLNQSGKFKSVKISKIEPGTDPGDLRGNEEEVCQYLQLHTGLLELNTESVFGFQVNQF